MSCYWDVHCLDCNVGMGLHLNRDPETCQEVVEFKEAIARLKGFSPQWGGDLIVSGESGRVDPAWMAEHLFHVIRPMSESGDFYGDCHAWDDSPQHQSCRLASGHGGDHSFLPLTPPWAEGFAKVLEAGKRSLPSFAARIAMRLKNFHVGLGPPEELTVQGNVVLAGDRKGRHVMATVRPGTANECVVLMMLNNVDTESRNDAGIGIVNASEKMRAFLRPAKTGA